jgi:hypothetical protein
MNHLSKMFTDDRFKQFGRYRYFRDLHGHKIGVVVAPMNLGYDSYTLNVSDFHRLIHAKVNGDLDDALVVGAKVKANGKKSRLSYRGEIDAVDLAHRLQYEETVPGKYGNFYVIHRGFAFPDNGGKDEDEPF